MSRHTVLDTCVCTESSRKLIKTIAVSKGGGGGGGYCVDKDTGVHCEVFILVEKR